MNIFDFINNAFNKRVDHPSLDDGESIYMLNRWASMSILSFTAAFKTNMYTLPRWASEALFYNKMKMRNYNPQLQYIRNAKDKVNPKKELIIKKLVNHFHCSKLHAEQILLIYTKKDINVYEAFGVKE